MDAETYWRQQAALGGAAVAAAPPVLAKRPRSEFDVPGEYPSYFGRNDERGAPRVAIEPDALGASYDRYLRGVYPPYAGGESARPLNSGLVSRPLEDPRMMNIGGSDPALAAKPRPAPLPADASSTLFVEGLPSNCSRREVAHIFRPFVGYKEVRLVTRDSRNPGGDPLVLCFVDFESPAEAATAKDALHGYVFDEHDRDSVSIRLQFARHPGARAGGGHRGRR